MACHGGRPEYPYAPAIGAATVWKGAARTLAYAGDRHARKRPADCPRFSPPSRAFRPAPTRRTTRGGCLGACRRGNAAGATPLPLRPCSPRGAPAAAGPGPRPPDRACAVLYERDRAGGRWTAEAGPRLAACPGRPNAKGRRARALFRRAGLASPPAESAHPAALAALCARRGRLPPARPLPLRAGAERPRNGSRKAAASRAQGARSSRPARSPRGPPRPFRPRHGGGA